MTMSIFGKLASFIAGRARVLARDVSGATAIEYGTVALFIAAVAAGAISLVGVTTNGLYETVLALVRQ